MDWSSVVLSALFGWASTLFFMWLVNRPLADGEPLRRLWTSTGVFWLLVLFSPIFILLAIAGGYIWTTGIDGEPPQPLLGVGLGLLLLYIGVRGLWRAKDSRTRSAEWDTAGLTIHQGAGPAKTYQWADLAALNFVFWLQAEQIVFKDGNRFIFFETMSGSQALLRACETALADEY